MCIDTFKASPLLLLEGLGQGSGAAAKSWLSTERPITIAYQKITDAGPLVTNPNGTKTFKQCKVGYVDDNKLLVELHQPDFKEIIGIEHLTHYIDTW